MRFLSSEAVHNTAHAYLIITFFLNALFQMKEEYEKAQSRLQNENRPDEQEKSKLDMDGSGIDHKLAGKDHNCLEQYWKYCLFIIYTLLQVEQFL